MSLPVTIETATSRELQLGTKIIPNSVPNPEYREGTALNVCLQHAIVSVKLGWLPASPAATVVSKPGLKV